MKRFRKTYGISGLLEWHGMVTSNGVKMKVDFTNGSVTAFGVAPATFQTSDLLTQTIMENSDQFKSGRIRLVGSVALPDEPVKEEPKAAAVEPTKAIEENTGPEEPTEPAEEGKLTTIEVACLDDAKAYLIEHFNLVASKLRSRVAIIESAKANGIVFTGI